MNNDFDYIMTAIANTTSNFVKKTCEGEKGKALGNFDGCYFETTITVLDKNGDPVAVARSTVSDNQKSVPSNYQYKHNQTAAPVSVNAPIQSAPANVPINQAPVNQVPMNRSPINSVSAASSQAAPSMNHETAFAPVSEPVQTEVESVKSVPNNRPLNSNLYAAPIPTPVSERPEQKPEPQEEPPEIPLNLNSNGNDKKQKIEDLLKRYSSLK